MQYFVKNPLTAEFRLVRRESRAIKVQPQRVKKGWPWTRNNPSRGRANLPPLSHACAEVEAWHEEVPGNPIQWTFLVAAWVKHLFWSLQAQRRTLAESPNQVEGILKHWRSPLRPGLWLISMSSLHGSRQMNTCEWSQHMHRTQKRITRLFFHVRAWFCLILMEFEVHAKDKMAVTSLLLVWSKLWFSLEQWLMVFFASSKLHFLKFQFASQECLHCKWLKCYSNWFKKEGERIYWLTEPKIQKQIWGSGIAGSRHSNTVTKSLVLSLSSLFSPVSGSPSDSVRIIFYSEKS